MHIGIIGAGAMGSIFAWYLHRGGTRALLFDTDPSTVRLIAGEGLRIIEAESEHGFAPRITATPADLAACDIVILFVKSYHTRDAMRLVAPYLAPGAAVVTLQNGLGNTDAIAEFFPRERILFGSTAVGAAKTAPGTVRAGGIGDTVFGGPDQDLARDLAALLANAGLPATITADPAGALWRKAIVNAGINPLGAILGITNGEVIANEWSRRCQELLVREGTLVARANGVDLGEVDMIEQTRTVCARTASNRCSMLQDIAAGRRTEIDAINGALMRYGEQTGIATPVNETMFLLVRTLEARGNPPYSSSSSAGAGSSPSNPSV